METIYLDKEAEKVNFVRKFVPSTSYDECLDMYAIYESYIAEGQTSIVARQYAGMLTARDIGEY